MQRLLDKFGRAHTYLRLSLTDKCNLRCTYCMPENIRFLTKEKLLSPEELIRLATLFTEEFGINKIRFTGGEPLARPEAREIFEAISKLPVKLAITTNGILLDQYLDQFARIGMRSLNISLDSFDPQKFKEITRRDVFGRVRENLDLAVKQGFRVKVNMVVMRGLNEEELVEFVRRTETDDIHVRFIEFMPFDGNKWEWDQVLGYEEMLEILRRKFELEKLHDEAHSTSKAHRVKGFKGTFSVISTVTSPFCEGCNRIRVTAEGKLRNCLFATREWDLREAMRSGEDPLPLILEAFQAKEARLGGLPEFQDEEALKARLSGRSMVKIGG